ncbi:Beta-xylosidase [Granulicella pectinivorans]|uniref:Beta-xylosidase n=1 Tax=Granulicella pectinivorans TaxID=474950 RepID=A0A1I6L563_9BACT|nr:glycoside hydrolase 43 family protein [Granulicella pectinivorans]SFR98615.1 Beta-xylosidase [Granulicella pectinivorans]
MRLSPTGAYPLPLVFRNLSVAAVLALCSLAHAQTKPSQVWVADQGDGTYVNPVLNADYSDPDAIRVGNDFYLVASSFDQVPGLPILHSKDLVNWELIGHALSEQPPVEVYAKTQHGNGVWAPAIRQHAGMFYIYYPDPEYGIYVTKAAKITGPWSTPKLVRAAKGWIDPCPLWDTDGNAYLINGMAGSRSGIKNVLILSRMSPDGEHMLDDGTIIIDGHGQDLTVEGPKIYKRNGFYYVFAPGGGVPTGYQLVYRAKDIYGPYERRVVLSKGSTPTNGPHQGAWVETAAGEGWFLHFQDRGPYGRVTHLEPLQWEHDWPVVGKDGEPVLRYKKPAVAVVSKVMTPPDSDEFDSARLGLQWQWQANPVAGWALPSQALGVLRLLNVPVDAVLGERLWTAPNVLTQKLPATAFTVTTKLNLASHSVGDRSGLVLLGQDYAYVATRRTEKGLVLVYGVSHDAGAETETVIRPLQGETVYLRMQLSEGARAQFFASEDGTHFTPAGEVFQARTGVWIGAKVGLFAQGPAMRGERSYVDVDWFRFER